MTFATTLECSACGRMFDPRQIQTVCSGCGSPLLTRYDLGALRAAFTKEELAARSPTLWRYRELLPMEDEAHVVSIGEPNTPLISMPRLAAELGLGRLWVKDETRLPTGTFKARGLALAVSRAVELGVRRAAIPSAGNAAEALAVYAARAGMECFVFMPKDAPLANQRVCQAAGARVFLVDGLISDAGKIVREGAAATGWFDFSTFREPYRLEGKKTMGLELAEQLGWRLPDVIVYPTGGGTGLVGMWKAFAELEALGWIGAERPRLVAVQPEGCAPIVRAFATGAERAIPWEGAATIAGGLRVPSPFADRLILAALRESRGTAVAVSDGVILEAMGELCRKEGVLSSPESAATLAATRVLRAQRVIAESDEVVLFNCGTLLKHVDLIEAPPPPVLHKGLPVDYGEILG
jgi:threonine synthase